MIITGAKGGKSGGGSGTESPNTLQSTANVTLVEALGEGKIKGLVDGYKSVKFDGTPIMNHDGTWNKQGVTIDYRLGLPDQAAFPGNTRTGTLVTVEEQVKINPGPLVRTISGVCDQVRVNIRIPALAYQNKDTGDLTGTSISYLVQRRASGGEWITMEGVSIVNQKNTSPYNRETVFSRPEGTEPFDIRVVRLTPDSTEVALQNDTYWESYTILVKGSYIYPNTALLQLKINSKEFGSNLGSITVECDGLETDVPNNYDPLTRTYTGVWDGTFKRAWHSNPAWVFYDLIVNSRYGLGEFVDHTLIDKWGLYTIARYCDELVPSGFVDLSGNPIMEPRFTFNGTINNRQEAYKVLQDISTAFRGMAYWSLGQVFASADMPQDPVTVVTPANVIGGKFRYSGTALKARHSVALVGWNDPQDNYKPAVELVQNNQQLAKFGWRQVDVALAGCTSRGQAHRFGKWILDTEQHETETVQFTMSWDGYVLKDNAPLKPGDIILLSNPRKNGGFRAGGRLAASTTSEVVLDFPFDPGVASYTLTCMLPDGSLQKRAVASFASDHKTLTLQTPFTAAPQVNGDWILEAIDLKARTYRVMSVEEEDDHLFKVTALFHDPTKYLRVEQNISLEPIQYVRPRDIVRSPINPTSVESRYFQNGVSHSRLTVSWQAPNGFMIRDYMVTADTPRGFQAFNATTYPSIDINDPAAGTWKFYISARGITGSPSVPLEYEVEVEGWQAVSGPVPDNLHTLEGGTTFSGRAPTIAWTNVFPPDTVTYPVTNIVRVYDPVSSTLLREERVTDPVYTYSYENNCNDAGGPRRSLRFDITALNVTGEEGAAASMTATNPVPAVLVPTVKPGTSSIDVAWASTDADYAGALVWVSNNPGFSRTLSNASYDGPDTSTTVFVEGGGTFYVWVAIYDSFGKIGLNTSAVISVGVNSIQDTINSVLPALLEANEDVGYENFEDVGDQLAGILVQVMRDRDDLEDYMHKRTRQLLAVESANARALVASEQTARIEADFAEATQRQALEVTINTNVIAAIATEAAVRASADEAQATQLTLLQAQINDDIGAAIANEQIARADGDSALASSISTLTTTVGGHTASLSTVATSIDGIELQYGVIGTIDGVTGGFLFTGVKQLDGSVSYNLKIQGDVIVNGTVTAEKLNVINLGAISANVGTLTAGMIRSTNNLVRFDLTNATLIVADS